MISNNFNNLTVEQKNNIYKTITSLFNKDNIEFFIEKKRHKIYQQEVEDLVLTKDFSTSKWEIFENIFNIKNFSSKKLEVIQKVVDDLEIISEKISFFNKIDEVFNFDLAIAGGALRDILLMQEPNIKDVDLILSFKYKKKLLDNYFNFGYNKSTKDKDFFKKSIITTSLKLKNHGFLNFDEEKITSMENLDDMIKEYLIGVLYSLINKDFNAEVFHKKEFKNTAKLQNIINTSEYIDKHLSGVIKIKDKNLNFDIDILLTSVEVDSYLKAFDYSICKIMSVVVKDNQYILKKNNIPDFLRNITLNDEIYDDLLKNQITFNIDRFTKQEIEKSIRNHYPRIKEKYPNLILKLKSEKANNIELIESINLFLELEENLKKNNSSEKLVSKI